RLFIRPIVYVSRHINRSVRCRMTIRRSDIQRTRMEVFARNISNPIQEGLDAELVSSRWIRSKRILLLGPGNGDLITRSKQQVTGLLIGFLNREGIARSAQLRMVVTAVIEHEDIEAGSDTVGLIERIIPLQKQIVRAGSAWNDNGCGRLIATIRVPVVPPAGRQRRVDLREIQVAVISGRANKTVAKIAIGVDV